MSAAIWWLRRDLRLADNQALAKALELGDTVVPLFVIDPMLVESDRVGEPRLSFLYDGLRALDDDLRERGSRLVVRSGSPLEVLRWIVRETGAGVLVAEEDATPYAVRRDRAVAESLPLLTVPGVTAQPLSSVQKADGSGFVVYSPFKRAWRAMPPPSRGDLIPAPNSMPPVPPVAGEAVPVASSAPSPSFPAGEAAARERLRGFVGGGDSAPIYDYARHRDRPDLDGTSRLSPYLRFGMLSPRAAVVEAAGAMAAAADDTSRRSAETWWDELIWREFFVAVMLEHPGVKDASFREDLRRIEWLNRDEDMEAWRDGRTGYPMVDAAMRQLATTGWMHNRSRMVVASFLTKDLLVDWRLGEADFMRRLVDGDPASNNGGWQWAAGTGTDAAPYFRVFNPTTQARRYDPAGAYIRRHVPELSRVPDAYVHAPWEMPREVQRESGCRVGSDYPAPIVDHAEARERALEAYGRAKSTGGRPAHRGA